MIAALLLAAVTIAFPKEGQHLPFVPRCYLSGATEPGVTNLVVAGRSVAVHPRGGWVTMIDVTPGTNVVTVGGARRTFFVDAPPAAGEVQPPKTYGKLAYAADEPAPRRTRTVVLDPGHGGPDTGALGPHSLPEKDANLRLALAVRAELVALGYPVEMTREDDSFPALYDRPKVAHAHSAAAFVSIHHNAPPLTVDPRTVRYHAVYAWNAIGEELAAAVNAGMAEAFGDALADKGVLHANFAVTRNPEIPSCLVETDFITTPEGEIDSWDPVRRRRVAAAIAKGIDAWFRRTAADGVRDGRESDIIRP